jgi:hypothetical protein
MVTLRDPATGRTVVVERRPIQVAALRPGDDKVRKLEAQLAEAGGLGTFTGLYEGDTRLRARIVDGRHGLSWLVDGDDAQRLGRKWITYGPKSAQQKSRGLRERPELAPAEVALVGGGRHVVIRRTGCRWGSDATLKFTTTGVTK